MKSTHNGKRFELNSPVLLPGAAGFLWNRQMMIQITCRGYAVAQYLQPEPAKYAYPPNLDAKTFLQPEQPYFAHHPGRFFYVKDEQSGALFSAPYEPVRAPLDQFTFSVGQSDIRWTVVRDGIAVDLVLTLPTDDVVELWSLRVTNLSDRSRRLSLYPYFPFGYMSWMNQGGRYHADLGGIVASCVTPYQKLADYFKNRSFKDKTYFLADQAPTAWEVRQEAFEGEGGLHNPTGIEREELANGDAVYETPAAILQYRFSLDVGQSQQYRFIFGPAFDEAEISKLRGKYLSPEGFAAAADASGAYIAEGKGGLWIETPDDGLDDFVNHWLPRQMYYHGDVNRLTTDPQTRNYLQDNMGMSYLKPAVARDAFLHALGQQEASGAMPDGILLVEGAELKFINEVPHTDHCVWLAVCLKAYLDETNDYGILKEQVTGPGGEVRSVLERISNAMRWLLQARDERGLSYIGQGDWCDPMNMVGYKGKGVSGWLSVATAYTLQIWAEICAGERLHLLADEFRTGALGLNRAVNRWLWDGGWYARGITDDGASFGVSTDKEGRIFLNAQSWSLLSGAASPEQRVLMMEAVADQLETPFGVMTLAPAFTGMREDIGRVTQKFPGSAENGSVYNHDAVFYIFSLYAIGEPDRAFRLLRQLIPGPGADDYLRRGQLPVFIPNYYRGAYHQFPRTAGRSSRLFNTGTVSWLYRCLIEGLFGVKGDREGLLIQPQLPAHWKHARLVRQFRGATFEIKMDRDPGVSRLELVLDGRTLPGNHITDIIPGHHHKLTVKLPVSPERFSCN